MSEDYTNVNKKTLDSLLFNILVSPSFDFNSSVLHEALSTGQVANYKNDSLKNLLYSLPTILADISLREKTITDDSNGHLIPMIYNYISLRQIDFKFSGFGEKIGKSKLAETDNRVLLNKRKFENILDNEYYLFTQLNMEYVKLENTLSNLSKLLEAEIKIYSPE